MAKLEDYILRNTTANRPTAGSPGRLFFDTTLGKLQRDNGSSWDDVEASITSTKLDDLATPDDNTDLNASAAKHGLLPKLSGSSSDVLKGDGSWGTGGGTGDVTWAIIQASQMVNEIKNFPANVGIDTDLDAANLWWDKISTPTTAPTMVDIAGEAGITETWEFAIKCVADANAEGFEQRITYDDEPRVKSGRKLSAIAAVWVVTAGRTVTLTLRNSTGETTTATATAQAWTIIKAENHTLAGTYVDIEFTIDGADTFYVVPLGANIGEKAFALKPRALRYIEYQGTTNAELLDGSTGKTFADVDLTSLTSNNAAMVRLYIFMHCNAVGCAFSYSARRNGDSRAAGDTMFARTWYGNSQEQWNDFDILCDDGQIIETQLDRIAGASTVATCLIRPRGWWEWE